MKLERMKEWREARGLSQRELARRAGIGDKTIARIELDDSVRPTTARKVAKALGVSVMDLIENPPVPLEVSEVVEVDPEIERMVDLKNLADGVRKLRAYTDEELLEAQLNLLRFMKRYSAKTFETWEQVEAYDRSGAKKRLDRAGRLFRAASDILAERAKELTGTPA